MICSEPIAGECARASVSYSAAKYALDDLEHALHGRDVVEQMVRENGERPDMLCNLRLAEQNIERARRVILALATPSVPAMRTPTLCTHDRDPEGVW